MPNDPEHSAKGIYVELDELLSYQAIAQHIAVNLSRVSQNLLQGNRPSKINGRGGSFDQIRSYGFGDDVRNIDWNVTARMQGDPFVRVFNEERQTDLMLLVDQSSDMFFATKKQLKSVLAARIAAQFTWMAHYKKQAYGAVIFDEQAVRFLRPQHQKASLIRLFDQLVQANHSLTAQTQASHASEQMELSLQRLLAQVSTGTLVVLISDFHHMSAQSWMLMQQIASKAQTIAIPIYDGAIDHWPTNGQLLASYAGIEVELRFNAKDDQPISTAPNVQQKLHQQLRHLEQKMQSFGVTVLPFSTYQDAQTQLAESLAVHHR